ncbi:unnamed protein product, partial [Meganyctiphanes norvegica]
MMRKGGLVILVQLFVLISMTACNSSERTQDRGRRVIVVVGGEDANWSAGRVEEVQLTRIARNLGYDVEVHTSHEVPCRDSWDDEDLLVYLPRSEGLLQKSAEEVIQILQDLGASIVIPQGEINVLVGTVESVRKAMNIEKVGSLGGLPSALRKHSIHHKELHVDTENKVFLVLDDNSHVGENGLVLKETDTGNKVLHSGDYTSCVVVARADSASARTLMLVTSDYLLPTLHEASTETQVTPHKVVVGIYIKTAQPYLDEAFNRLSEMDGKNTHIYIFNEVDEYHSRLASIQHRLQEKFGLKYVSLLQASGTYIGYQGIKNMIIGECLRLQCDFYMNFNSHVLMDKQLPKLLFDLDLPVVTPAIKLQIHEIATFVRGNYDDPNVLDDMEYIVNNQPEERRLWHASCVQAIYVIRRDILEQLPTLYSQTGRKNSEIALCENLRAAGIPMYIHGGFPELDKQYIINSEDYKIGSPDVVELEYNQEIWMSLYLDPLIVKNNSTHLERIKGPCHEVYDFPLFTSKFTEEVIQLAEKRNQWAVNREPVTEDISLVRDYRKKSLYEAIPTVDQYLENLGLNSTSYFIYNALTKYYLELAYYELRKETDPHISLVARFQASEQPGLPLHHDCSIVTGHINLTPSDQYEGGWLEFPVQGGCRLRPEAGRMLMYPGRFTHPKIMHNVTQGVLHKILIFHDTIVYDGLTEEMIEEEKSNKRHRRP